MITDPEQKFWDEKFNKISSDWHQVYEKLLVLVDKSATQVEASKNEVKRLNENFASLRKSNFEKYLPSLLTAIGTLALVGVGLWVVNQGVNFKVGPVEITKQQN